MSERTKGGNIVLERVSAPDTVDPGEPFEVDAVVKNGAAFIGPFDNDSCRKNGEARGYSLEVVFSDGSETRVSGPTCMETKPLSRNAETHTETFTAPESGTIYVDAFVRLPGSGKETGEISQTVSVTTTDSEEPDPPADTDDESDDDGGNDDDSDGGSNPLAAIFPFLTDGGGGGGLNALLGVLVLLAIAWMLDSGSDIAG
ncbi:hypothetical protein [Halosegnis longus]|uniref:hypothetical protein n=1 Tax=Halosegnis longus TaxID=2216012 RepID=UPI00129DB791|nr:hypothetical protein [Halosegnis longus]